jgi:hypothetical protein
MWNWVNRWYGSSPIDECAYRKRKIMAFTTQPILFLIGRLIAGVVCTLYSLIGSFFLLFLGYRPTSLIKNILHSWWDIDFFESDLFEYYNNRWRRWGEDKFIPTFLVPYVVVFELLGLYVVFVQLKKLWVSASSVSVSPVDFLPWLIGSIVGFSLFFLLRMAIKKIYNPKRIQRAEEARVEARKQILKSKEELYVTYLKENTVLSKAPKSVDIKKILPKVSTVTKFHLSFWNLKSKVCRPFVR